MSIQQGRAQSLDAQGLADNFPGRNFQPSRHGYIYNEEKELLGALAMGPDTLKIYPDMYPILSEDAEFRYRRVGISIYREYKNPRPQMSFIDARPIPHAPSLQWPGWFEFHSDETAPSRPNCSEKKFGYNEYMKIVSDPSVKTKAQFLEKIPRDALQKFTFIHKSQSLQKDGVTKMTPRVMRFSSDGRFALTYTTNKDIHNHATIEVIYFDDQTRRYNFLHSEFLTNSQSDENLRPKTLKNPKSCFSCHGGQDPRPNWAAYDKWPGVYGASDDTFNKFNLEKDGATLEDYKQMLSSLSQTPEIKTLPWPDQNSNLYPYFPFTKIPKEKNYNLRPNAHYTIVSSRLNAQRLARKFQESPAYPKVKWSLLARAMDCGQPQNPILNEMAKINDKGYSGLLFKKRSYGNMFQGVPLYSLGRSFQFVNTDWSLEFEPKPSRNLRPFETSQWEMSDFVLSVLFRDLAKEEPALKPFDVRINRMANQFGSKFTCVDEIADRLWRTDQTFEKSCQIVLAKADEEIKSIIQNDLLLASGTKNEIWPERKWESSPVDPKVLGQSILKNTCATCHQDATIPFNFNTMDMFSKEQPPAAKNAYIKHIQNILGDEKSCRMPKPIAGPCLSSKEKQSVIKFLQSL